MTATSVDAVNGSLPLGWQELKTPDGKVYYSHPATAATSWTRPPANPLPSGWKMLKTPDNVPFYVHDGFQISTWDRPGELPRAKASVTAAAPGTKPGRKPSVKPGKGITARDVATAASVANNLAKLSAASDLSPSGIFTATVAATKLAGLGVKIAGKKMGRMGKGKRLSTATNLLGTAARLAGDDDGGDDDCGDDEGDIEEEDEEAYEPQPEVVEPTNTGPEPVVSEPYGAPAPQPEVYYGDQQVLDQQQYYATQPAGLPPEPFGMENTMLAPQPTGYTEQPGFGYGPPPADIYGVPPHQESYAPRPRTPFLKSLPLSHNSQDTSMSSPSTSILPWKRQHLKLRRNRLRRWTPGSRVPRTSSDQQLSHHPSNQHLSSLLW